ncbi:MAG TPA: hypothetical protein VNB64_01130, partial [Solirubrobacteraceae bacterium]|nr:hypothetical protein [Solirubrobacteraceae bacterium]
MDLRIERASLRFREPLRTAFGTLAERELLLVHAEGGVGEAAPLEPYDGVSLDAVEAALRAAAGEPTPEAALARLDDGPPQARAALDMALWDARGRREGRPVAELLGEA